VPFKWLLINLIAAWKTTSRWGGAATEFLNELLRHSTKDMFSLRQGGVRWKITHKRLRVQISAEMKSLGMSFKRESSMREQAPLALAKQVGSREDHLISLSNSFSPFNFLKRFSVFAFSL
jgi:hypothetical protein